MWGTLQRRTIATISHRKFIEKFHESDYIIAKISKKATF